MNMRIACLGDNCIDYYDDTQQAFPGGNPVNVAVYMRRLGCHASYIGMVGNDRYGELMLRTLKEKDVDISHVHVRSGTTAISHVTILDGDRIFGDYDEGVMKDFRPSDADIDFICTHDLAVTALWGHCEHALEAIRARGIPAAFDAADRPFDKPAQIAAANTTVFFFSDDSSDEPMLREKLEALHRQGPDLVVVTRGAKGSMAYDGREFCFQDVMPCRVVDTMGAGDSFIAGFLAAWLKKQPLRVCMGSGAKNAAAVISYHGAWL